jgi:periplasmic protein TonB
MSPWQPASPENDAVKQKPPDRTTMIPQDAIQHNIFFRFFSAAIVALVLNMTMFGLMPGLLDKSSQKPKTAADFQTINVVRIKKPDTPVKKKKLKKNEPIKQKRMMPGKTITRQQKAPLTKIRLPFEINPVIPAAPGAFTTPAMAHITLDRPSLKESYAAVELDRPLITLVQIPPVYPLKAKRRHIEGWVTVKFLVTHGGDVENISIVDAEPKKIFDKSVIRCVSSWRFKPGTVGGNPVNTQVQTTIRFKLE